MSPLRTPVNNLRLFDHMPASEAVVEAWTNEGAMPTWHRAAQSRVRSAMPLLARALDRMALINEEAEGATPPMAALSGPTSRATTLDEERAAHAATREELANVRAETGGDRAMRFSPPQTPRGHMVGGLITDGHAGQRLALDAETGAES